ncbi:amidohydrolase family protein [Actinoplanes sp. TBRC 11911]|nr:amidohydrolase family protein [Actinoplanes sp. TBRC 11911]
MESDNQQQFGQGRPVLLRGGTVLTMDTQRRVLTDADILVVGDQITAIGPRLAAPDDAAVIDARGGVVMPGMIDTHRHMWQTSLRGYGADWTLTQYVVVYLMQYGRLYRPEDIYAGNLLAAIEAIDSGVTTVVDWSHGLRTVEHGAAALDALRAVPGRFVLAYGGNIEIPNGGWATTPDFRQFADRHLPGDDMLQFQLALDVTSTDGFPEQDFFDVARDLGVAVTTHAGIWGYNGDDSIRNMYDHGAMRPGTIYIHGGSLSEESFRRIADTGGFLSISTESEQSAGQGYPPTAAAQAFGVPVSLSTDTSVWWSSDMFTAMRATLGAHRARGHLQAHEKGETLLQNSLRAEDVVDWATRGGAHALGRGSDLGSLEPGKKADIVLVKNESSPVGFPVLNPYGHVTLQAQRADVHSVLVNGRVVKHKHQLIDIDLTDARRKVEDTVDHLRGLVGEEQWNTSMNPDLAA